MTVELNSEQTQIIHDAMAAGLIRTPDEVISAGIDVLRARLEARHNEPGAMDADDWARELHAWVHSHSSATPILPDAAMERDSIYGIRGR